MGDIVENLVLINKLVKKDDPISYINHLGIKGYIERNNKEVAQFFIYNDNSVSIRWGGVTKGFQLYDNIIYFIAVHLYGETKMPIIYMGKQAKIENILSVRGKQTLKEVRLKLAEQRRT